MQLSLYIILPHSHLHVCPTLGLLSAFPYAFSQCRLLKSSSPRTPHLPKPQRSLLFSLLLQREQTSFIIHAFLLSELPTLSPAR